MDKLSYGLGLGIGQQLAQMWSYLTRMAETLNMLMDEIGYTGLTDEERAVMRPILKEDELNSFISLKRMIMRIAEYVTSE